MLVVDMEEAVVVGSQGSGALLVRDTPRYHIFCRGVIMLPCCQLCVSPEFLALGILAHAVCPATIDAITDPSLAYTAKNSDDYGDL